MNLGRDHFIVEWVYGPADNCIFGLFASYEKAEEWAKKRQGSVRGIYNIHKLFQVTQ